ncbi:MAG: site-2 protease family protein [Candidatus Omnitrophota bacterium]
MKLSSRFNEGLKIFMSPAFIGVYFGYSLLNALLSKFLIPVHILAVIFLEPLLFSYFVSRYFIDVVDPSRMPDHRRLRFKLYVPFVKIFGVLFVLTVLIQSAYFTCRHQSAGVPFSLLCLFSLLSTTVVFWMAAVIFCGRGAWYGLRQAFFLVRRNIPVYGLFFIVYLMFAFFHDRFGFGDWNGGGIVPFVVFHIVYAVSDLYITRMTIGLAALSFDKHATMSVLGGYTSGNKSTLVREVMAVQIKKSNLCLFLGLMSVVPGVHFFAAVLGWRRFKHQEFGRFRSISGCMLGVFFTCIYCLSFFSAFVFHQKGEFPLSHISSLDRYICQPNVSGELKQILRKLRTSPGYDTAALVRTLGSMKDAGSAARYFALGVAQSYANQPQAALASFKKSRDLPDADPEALFHVGRINLFYTHDYFEARNSLARYLNAVPGDRTAQLYISLIDNRVGWDKNWMISILSVIALLIAITTHEFGHSFTAYKCGDTTSKAAGRMSLNPIVHLDLFGSIILPAFLILSRSGIIVGWAKPVPVNPENFRNPQRDRTLVSLMGCLTNFSLALATTVFLVFLTVILRLAVPDLMTINWLYPLDSISVAGLPFARGWAYFVIFLRLMIMINIAIGIFNLIPIPPLDGSWILERRLAHFLKKRYAAYQQFSFLLILILLFTGVIDIVITSVLNAYFFFMQIVTLPVFSVA